VSVALLAVWGPLLAAALIVLLRRAAPALALIGALSCAVAAGVTLLEVADGARPAASYGWLPGLPLVVAVDPLAALLAATVAGVALLVLVYAVGYLRHEASGVRFYAALSLFLAAMQALVVAGDWVLLLGAWELIGFASYLLIGYWYEREDARRAATRAFVTIRATDLGLYLGVFVLITATGTTELAATLGVSGTTASIAGLLLLLAASGKAAQTPFHGWLADAMAGPTPVSALLHSATLVAAGVILLLRIVPLLPADVLLVVALTGGLTTLLTGLTAFAQRDLKRLLAASTSSQLGLMLLALGAGSPAAATVHLLAHAAIKSALFLGAGVFQHARGATAFDRLAGAGREQPAAYAAFAVAGLSLAGLPPLAGFWSKDAILAAAFASSAAWLLGPVALLGSVLTGMYIARALRVLWQNGGQREATPGNRWMASGLGGLALAAALLGLAVEPVAAMLDAELPAGALAVTLGVLATLGGLAAGWLVPAERLLGGWRAFAEVGFRIDGGWWSFVARPLLRLAHSVAWLDTRIHGAVLVAGRGGLRIAGAVRLADRVVHGSILGAGVLTLRAARAVRLTDQNGIDALIAGLVRRTRELGRHARQLQTGLVHQELAFAVVGMAAVLVVVAVAALSG